MTKSVMCFAGGAAQKARRLAAAQQALTAPSAAFDLGAAAPVELGDLVSALNQSIRSIGGLEKTDLEEQAVAAAIALLEATPPGCDARRAVAAWAEETLEAAAAKARKCGLDALTAERIARLLGATARGEPFSIIEWDRVFRLARAECAAFNTESERVVFTPEGRVDGTPDLERRLAWLAYEAARIGSWPDAPVARPFGQGLRKGFFEAAARVFDVARGAGETPQSRLDDRLGLARRLAKALTEAPAYDGGTRWAALASAPQAPAALSTSVLRLLLDRLHDEASGGPEIEPERNMAPALFHMFGVLLGAEDIGVAERDGAAYPEIPAITAHIGALCRRAASGDAPSFLEWCVAESVTGRLLEDCGAANMLAAAIATAGVELEQREFGQLRTLLPHVFSYAERLHKYDSAGWASPELAGRMLALLATPPQSGASS